MKPHGRLVFTLEEAASDFGLGAGGRFKHSEAFFCRADTLWTGRAAFDADIPWRRVAATPRLRRGYSVETSRGDAAAATRTFGAHHRYMRDAARAAGLDVVACDREPMRSQRGEPVVALVCALGPTW